MNWIVLFASFLHICNARLNLIHVSILWKLFCYSCCGIYFCCRKQLFDKLKRPLEKTAIGQWLGKFNIKLIQLCQVFSIDGWPSKLQWLLWILLIKTVCRCNWNVTFQSTCGNPIECSKYRLLIIVHIVNFKSYNCYLHLTHINLAWNDGYERCAKNQFAIVFTENVYIAWTSPNRMFIVAMPSF